MISRDLPTLSYAAVLRAMSALADAKQWASIVAVFDVVSAADALRARFTQRIYTHLFFALLKIGGKRQAVRAYGEWGGLVRRGVDATFIGPRAYNFVYVLLSRCGMVDEALDVRENCVKNGYYLNRYSYNAFLNACAKSYRIADAFETLREMAESHVLPDVVSFNVLISCCVRSGDLDIALGILHRMKDWGISPDVYSYNSVINGLRKNKMMREAFEIVAQMEMDVAEERGEEMTVITDALMEVARQEGKEPPEYLKEAAATALEARRSDTPLISALTAARRGEKMEIGERRRNGEGRVKAVGPDLVTYNTMISGLASVDCQDVGLALGVKKHMEGRGMQCNEVTYNALMAVAARSDHGEEAFGIYEEMISRGLKPNCECFTTLITLCGRLKMMERAFEIHGQMVGSGVGPSVITFNALLTACRSVAGNEGGKRALEVLERMKGVEGCAPDVISYSTVIDVLGRSGRFGELRMVLGEMGRDGVEPNLVTYTSVISALTRAGDVDGAMGVLVDMEGRGIKPNVYTFSSLIHGAGRAGDLKRAFKLLKMMRERGIVASRVTYSMLLQLASRSEVEEYLELVVKILGEDDRLAGSRQMDRILEAWKLVQREGNKRRVWAFHVMNDAMCELVSN